MFVEFGLKLLYGFYGFWFFFFGYDLYCKFGCLFIGNVFVGLENDLVVM